jgi:CheY-like chemotaxis protein
MEATMFDFRVAIRTTLLLVDDDIRQLDLLDHIMKMSGFSVVTANSPIDAIALMNEQAYHPQNRCCRDWLPDASDERMRSRRIPEGPISGTQDCFVFSYSRRPEGEMMSLDGFIAKGDGIGALLSKITEFQDYRIRGLQNSGESIRQLPLYSRSRTMLLLKP